MATPSVLITAKSQEPRDTIKAMPFLDLAAELRNLIYEHISDTTPLRLSRKKQTLINPSRMLLVNKQIAKEYHDLALKTATIATRVINFDFDHVTAFLDNLSDKDAARLTGKSPVQTIRLELSSTAPAALSWLKFVRWLDNSGDANRTASKIIFQYVWKGKIEAGLRDMGGHVMVILDDIVRSMRTHGRPREDGSKIRAAMVLGARAHRD